MGSNKPGREPEHRVECIATLADALEWLGWDVESVMGDLNDQHREAVSVSLDPDRLRECERGKVYRQALELLELCERGEPIPSFVIGEEDYWFRPVDDCKCPCNCDEPCDGSDHHEAVGPFVVPTA
ncbi:hypothetical protein [Streptomyces graminofaciens]|uniref:hypothetical protein n=1 Tax=Streptomyces graminofaciens TaxID=68212 RepID=UPI002572B9AD|nr:hypothetical protein [Streptomyces graminofaciens]